MRSRIMYIEDKSGGPTGPARIGRVRFPKTGRLPTRIDADVREEYWREIRGRTPRAA